MNVLRDDFVNFLIENDRASNTISAYLSDLEKFTYDEMTTETIRQYTEDLQLAGLAISTINRRLVALKQYIKFLAECKGVAVAPKIRQLKQQKKNYLDDVLSEKDFASLLRSTEKKEDQRAAAIFCTLAYTGMRVSEMLQLTIADVKQDTITINGKGSKRREVFLSDKLKTALKAYLAVRTPSHKTALFTGQRGAINRQTVDGIIKEHAGYIRLKMAKAHAHNFRHLFCKVALDRGLDIATVADLAGHSDINTTRTYTRKTKKELMAAIERI